MRTQDNAFLGFNKLLVEQEANRRRANADVIYGIGFILAGSVPLALMLIGWI